MESKGNLMKIIEKIIEDLHSESIVSNSCRHDLHELVLNSTKTSHISHCTETLSTADKAQVRVCKNWILNCKRRQKVAAQLLLSSSRLTTLPLSTNLFKLWCLTIFLQTAASRQRSDCWHTNRQKMYHAIFPIVLAYEVLETSGMSISGWIHDQPSGLNWWRFAPSFWFHQGFNLLSL